MKFNEWLEKLNSQQKRVDEFALSEAYEAITVEGKTIQITLGKGKYECEVGKHLVGARWLRSLYTHNKEEFDAMLESLTEQIDKIAQATEVILESVGREAIPNAVLERLKGEKVEAGPAELVVTLVEKRLKELTEIIKKRFGSEPIGHMDSFEANLSVANKDMALAFNLGEISITWGRVSINSHRYRDDIIHVHDVEEGMFLLANYKLIKEKILDFMGEVEKVH